MVIVDPPSVCQRLSVCLSVSGASPGCADQRDLQKASNQEPSRGFSILGLPMLGKAQTSTGTYCALSFGACISSGLSTRVFAPPEGLPFVPPFVPTQPKGRCLDACSTPTCTCTLCSAKGVYRYSYTYTYCTCLGGSIFLPREMQPAHHPFNNNFCPGPRFPSPLAYPKSQR
jgi:hypothetical protein